MNELLGKLKSLRLKNLTDTRVSNPFLTEISLGLEIGEVIVIVFH